ncbi:MAG TPA: hypothetical protein VGI11_08950, partial [Variovorax sp.]
AEVPVPVLPPSLYGSIDDELLHETVMSPDLPAGPAAVQAPPAAKPVAELDLAEFDRTAYETIAAPIEPAKPPPASDPHLIDFELFDPNTEAEIAPRPTKR